jgi:hypothetical protein
MTKIKFNYRSLDTMHPPVFYLKQLNSVDLPVSHMKHITSPLQAQQVNVICRLWRWCINITMVILHIIHRRVFYLKLISSL